MSGTVKSEAFSEHCLTNQMEYLAKIVSEKLIFYTP